MWITTFAMNAISSLWDWSKSHMRLAIEGSLVIVLLLIGHRYKAKQTELQAEKDSHAKIAAGLIQQITIKNGEISILKKQGTIISSQNQYLPPEGSIVIQQKDMDAMNAALKDAQDKLVGANLIEEVILKKKISDLEKQLSGSAVTVKVNDWGFTLKPGLGVGYAGGTGLTPRADIKWFYWKRYSLMNGFTKEGADISASRHLDDVLYGSPKNIEIYAGWQFLRRVEASPVTAGIRVNLW